MRAWNQNENTPQQFAEYSHLSRNTEDKKHGDLTSI